MRRNALILMYVSGLCAGFGLTSIGNTVRTSGNEFGTSVPDTAAWVIVAIATVTLVVGVVRARVSGMTTDMVALCGVGLTAVGAFAGLSVATSLVTDDANLNRNLAVSFLLPSSVFATAIGAYLARLVAGFQKISTNGMVPLDSEK